MYLDLPTRVIKTNFFYALNRPVKPTVVAFKVTYRCNMRCSMCGNFSRMHDYEKELTASDINRAFTDPYLKDFDVIRITGGEPFLKEDLNEIICAMHKNVNCKFYFITTNCTLIERVEDLIRNLIPKGLTLIIQVSLDSLGKEHDEIRKVKGAGKLVVENLIRLIKLREKYNFFLGINQTVSAKNITKIKEMNEFCQNNNIDHMLLLASKYHESDEKADFESFNSDFELHEHMNYKEINEFYNSLKEIENHTYKKAFYNLLRHFTESYIHYHAKNRLLLNYVSPLPKCMAYFNYFRITPDGAVIPCTLRSGLTIGNLKELSFGEMWNSSKARKYRNVIRSCQGCWVHCDIIPSIPYSLHFYKWAASSLDSFNILKRVVKMIKKRYPQFRMDA